MADRLLLEYPTKILLEDGTSALLLEDGTLILNESSATLATDAAQLEDASGVILLEPIPINYLLTAQFGAFVLSSQTATLVVARLLTASQGSFTLTPETATLAVARKVTATFGAFTLTSETATLKVDRLVTASFGSFTLSAQTAGMAVARVLTAGAGSFSLTGVSATLTYTPVVVPAPVPVPSPVAISVATPVILPEAPQIIQPLPGVIFAQPFVQAQPQKVESHGSAGLSMEIPWYRRRKNELKISAAIFKVTLGKASFRLERKYEVIIPRSDYDLLCSGGSFISMGMSGSKWEEKKRQSRHGKFVLRGGKASFQWRKAPPPDDEEEEIIPVKRWRRHESVSVMERDDEEAIVLMLGRMDW